jgi:hypothetical protein
MRFKNLFRIFFGLAVLSVTLDYLVTVLGFGRHIEFEINPHIMFMRRFVDRYHAASIVFFATLGLVLASYWAVSRLFRKPPYNGGLRKVWRHLWYGVPTRRDLVIFALIALYLYFTYLHLWGAKTWLDIFRIHGF